MASSMDVKVGELLKEVQVDAAAAKAIDRAVSAVIDAIRAIPDQPVTSDAASAFVRDVGAPTDKLRFTFRPPASVRVAGSRSISAGALARPEANVDLLVPMPSDCFHEKDRLNHRYHAKRCLYLRVIEQALRSSPVVNHLRWSTFQGEGRKPLLHVFPAVDLLQPFEFYIRIIPAATSLFDVTKLGTTKNNVRAFNQGDVSRPTPKYNSSILEDMFLEENSEFVRKVFSEWKSLQEALVLLKVWARQRSSIYTHDCLNGYLLSIIMAYLSTESGGNHINKAMNALQIFRVTLKFLASSILWDKGHSLDSQGQRNLSKESFGAVLIDVSGNVNLAYRMRKTAISELQDEASWTLQCIEKCRDGGFEEIFMTKVDFAAKFDSCLRINLKQNEKINISDFCLDDECWRTYEDNVGSLLQQGLSDRAKLIRVSWRNTPSNWKIEDGLLEFGSEPMLVGILYNSEEKSFRVVDIGPNAENKEEAVKFRNFWGEKAELRRFRDGTIAESTVWESKQWERHLIVKRIAEHILLKHLLISTQDMVHIVDQLDFCLHLEGKDTVSFSGNLLGAFELLAKRLRLLEDIPLRVSSVQPLDPAFRHTSVFPPEPHPLAYEKCDYQKLPKFASTCIQPLDVMIQLEGSGKWPLDDLVIEKTKSAFLIKIGESLQDHWGMSCSATEDDMIVLMCGYAFRLKILHERGLNLLNQVGKSRVKSTPSIDKELFLRSQHSSMINGLHGRYPTYGPVVRLAKRWVASHLFSSFLAEEAIELIVAYVFLKPFPFHCPCSRINGFLRFLRLLSNYDWTFSTMIVDINDELTPKDEKEINEHFILSRKSSEGNVQHEEPAMFLATSYDRLSEAWTKISPNKSILKRLAAYARSSANLLTNLILQGPHGPYTWECLFRTPLNNYDAVILLHRDKLPYPRRLLFPTEMNQGKHVICGKASKKFHPYVSFVETRKSAEDARESLMVNFDPTKCLLEDLKREYADMFEVWYDSLGGDAIALTRKNDGSKKRGRDEANECGRVLVDSLKDVGGLGKGFVRSVYSLKAPRVKG